MVDKSCPACRICDLWHDPRRNSLRLVYAGFFAPYCTDRRAALALGLLAWLVVGGVVLVDTLDVPMTPTAHAVVFRVTAVPTVTGVPTATASPDPGDDDRGDADERGKHDCRAQQPAMTATIIPTPTDSTDNADDLATEAPPISAPSTPGGCAKPDGWTSYTVEPGDTLFGFQLGAKGQVDVAAIMAGNCLTSKVLAIGQAINLPPGAADNAPKIDDGPAPSGAIPDGPSRTPHCPCTIVVREGWRLEQVAAEVDSVPVGFSGRDFMAATAPGAPVPDLAFLRSRPAGKSLEGFMFPGTYTLDNGTSAVQFRDMVLNAFAANVGDKVVADSAARGISFWQVIVLASIVDRESRAPSEQKLIASVFYNRLIANKGIAATVSLQYALGRPGNWWPRIVGSAINTDSPYNTNIYAGLPPSPIASPSLSAILAAVYPAQTELSIFRREMRRRRQLLRRDLRGIQGGVELPVRFRHSRQLRECRQHRRE